MLNLKILIINPFGIGDVIFSTPLIEALKKNRPGIFIGYVCNKRVYEVLKNNPLLDEIFVYEKDDYREAWKKSKIGCIRSIWALLNAIRRARFDVALDLSLGYQYSMLLKLIGIRKRIGFNYKNRGRFLTDRTDIDGFNDKHVVEYYLELLKHLDIDPKACRAEPRVYITDENKAWADRFLSGEKVARQDLLVGIVPGCGASWGMDAKYRRWSRMKFAKLADMLIDRYGVKVILFGSLQEVGLCQSIREAMKNSAIMACGKTSIGGFLGLLERCCLVITNDGGPLHMASALKLRTVSIFGPVDERIYGPYPGGANDVVVSKKDLPCRPCYRRFKYNVCKEMACLNGIEVEDVFKAASQFLDRERSGAGKHIA